MKPSAPLQLLTQSLRVCGLKTNFSKQMFWRHSLRCGLFARTIAHALQLQSRDILFTLGVLHDVGRAAIIQQDRKLYQKALEFMHHNGVALWQAEQKVFGYNHADVGGFLAQKWRLPPVYASVITCHHEPERTIDYQTFAYVIRLADALAHSASPKDRQGIITPPLVGHLWSPLGLSDQAVRKIYQESESIELHTRSLYEDSVTGLRFKMAEKLQSALGRIQILSQAFDSWIVEFRIELNELLDNERLLHHLRGVKQVISSSQSIPENSLLLDGIVRKVNDGEWVDVVVRIKKRVFVSGAPRVTLLEKMDSNGATYSNMIAVLDLFYLDEFENAITLDRVMRAIRGANIAGHLVDNDILSGKIAEVLATQMPIKVSQLRKELPASGKDATLAFYFQAYANSSDVDTLYSSRRVGRVTYYAESQSHWKASATVTTSLAMLLSPAQDPRLL
ncbi:MAG: HDOD domain-containing protein [bacterium]|nr:HDOD domain-containing protein [bacterium]